MSKQFTHKDLDRISGCNWSYTSPDEDEIIREAIKHVLSCKEGFRYQRDSLLLRATMRALIHYTEQNSKGKKQNTLSV